MGIVFLSHVPQEVAGDGLAVVDAFFVLLAARFDNRGELYGPAMLGMIREFPQALPALKRVIAFIRYLCITNDVLYGR